ncbi:MAG: transketolase [Treponema sp.]|uniref:transketolase n=1 Tax=Treponema sp. TaxID=166 RepID=UPI003FA261D8
MNKELDATALSIRSLSIDAIEKANSGHPGLPLGAAELAAVLYGKLLRHNPQNPQWVDRDRFILSAGHGSMLLYSILHLSGYDLSLDDIRSFRQVGSRCPGHPEYGMTPGVEATTGPLGQGIATAVGMAVAESMLAARFNTADYTIVDHYTYALVGEGCLMEGVSSEASSLAGTLKLGKLIVYYDQNKITIDGSTDIAFTEDIAKRYESYGWQVLHGSMYSYSDIETLTEQAKKDPRPSLIMLDSVIGKGAPAVEGTAAAHGAPLGKEKLAQAKEHLGLNPAEQFFVAPEAYAYFADRKKGFEKQEADWNTRFAAWSAAHPALRKEWDGFFEGGGIDRKVLDGVADPVFKVGEQIATRAASKTALNVFAKAFPNLVGGSADLQGPNAVALQDVRTYTADSRDGRYIHFGIREFAMAAITNGIQLHGGFRAFCATFAVFSDYLRPALRLAALMKIPSIYVLTHDSIFVGEDGPTHQPVEVLASLRAIPNVLVLRPADAEETAVAWRMALEQKDRPTCLLLSRQNLPVLQKADPDWKTLMKNSGAYIIRNTEGSPDVTVLATGSEVSMACEAAGLAAPQQVRVVSVPSKELLDTASDTYRKQLAGDASHRSIVAEAGVKQGWEGWVLDPRMDIVSIDRFGESGPAKKVAEHLGFTAEALAARICGKCGDV